MMEFSTVMDDEGMYIDYVNNFLTVDAFADAWKISKEKASEIIENGRQINNK